MIKERGKVSSIFAYYEPYNPKPREFILLNSSMATVEMEENMMIWHFMSF